MFAVRAVPRLLTPFVEAIWYYESSFSHEREQVLPTAAPQLLINLHADMLCSYDGDLVKRTRGAVLSGARSRPMVINTASQRRIVGVTLRPGGGFALLGIGMHEVIDDNVDLDLCWNRWGSALRERVLEAREPHAMLDVVAEVLVAACVRPVASDVQHALALLRGGHRVREVVEQIGTRHRSFIDRFSQHVGLKPKHFARVSRFQGVIHTLARGPEKSFASLAAQHGYFDQAHLIREFRLLAGTTPLRYAPRSSDEPSHVPL